jgi:glycosyltransferase involved in cell wall biosynthesis
LDRQLPRRADACIAVTPQIVEFIEQMGTAVDTWTIFPAIDLTQFDRPAAANQGARPQLLYAGNLDEYQNLSFVLRCFQSVLSQRSDCHLSIVTHSSPRHLTRAAAGLGLDEGLSIIHLDSFETMKAHLFRCHLTLCPRVSPYGFPIKLLNYLAAGKPVIACRSSAQGLTHMVDGWVVEDNDLTAFTGAIMTLIEDEKLRKRLSQNARRTAEEKFSWENSAERYEEVYQATLNRCMSRKFKN